MTGLDEMRICLELSLLTAVPGILGFCVNRRLEKNVCLYKRNSKKILFSLFNASVIAMEAVFMAVFLKLYPVITVLHLAILGYGIGAIIGTITGWWKSRNEFIFQRPRN